MYINVTVAVIYCVVIAIIYCKHRSILRKMKEVEEPMLEPAHMEEHSDRDNYEEVVHNEFSLDSSPNKKSSLVSSWNYESKKALKS